MEAFSGSPMTLVVKAPNQEIGDQTVECFLDWTVQKLKKHLSSVYPTNPHERSQRIIYSGKLLQDNAVLKDVLTVSAEQDKCTVHLVCTPSSEDLTKRKESSKTWASQKRTVLPNATSSSSSDGLRHRTTASSSSPSIPSPASSSSIPSSQPASLPGASQHQQQQQNPTAFASATSLPYAPGAVPVSTMSHMTPEQQMQWMQQMYAQQMYYMQYASMMAASGQQGWPQGYNMASPWLQQQAMPTTTATPQLPQPQPQQPVVANVNNIIPPQGVANAPLAAPNRNPAQQAPQVMNVGGGGAMPVDDEDGVRRDWLDWTFTLCRFGILLSIVYFYSSIDRFLVVGGAMFLLYLYQAGFFQIRRRNRPPVTPPQQQPQQGEQGEDANDQPEESDGSTSAGDETDGNTAAEPAEPPRPGILATAWIFLSTFVTSIIPQGPQQFPAN